MPDRAAAAREIIARGEEILEARKNPDAGRLKWADFGDVYDAWNRKAEDLIARVCGPSMARKWNFANCRAMYHLDQERDFCLEEQQRKQDMLHERLGGKSTGAANVTAAQPAAPSSTAPQESFVKTPAYRAGRPKLPERFFRVWKDYEFACSKSGKHSPLDRDLYEWLKVNGRADCTAKLHDFETWARYLRNARTLMGKQKHRSASSVDSQ